jgi:hypothetical protein
MAFDLKDFNGSGVAVITDNLSSLRALPENFASSFDYLSQNVPELVPELMYANGKGSILGFMRAVTNGTESTFESDYVQHAEVNRLHKILTGVSATNNVFTCGEAHGLRVKDVVRISDGTDEYQGIVSAINSGTVFTALSDGVAFAFSATPVSVQADFSSRFLKGDDAFTEGKKQSMLTYKFHPQIVQEFYEISDSDLAQKTWVQTGAGPMWWNFELDRTYTKFDNKIELTAIFHKRAADNAPSTVAGNAQGLNGVIPTIESRGNISNDFITTQDDLSDLAKRIKRQGTSCREYTMWCGHDQMARLRILCAGLNSSFMNGSHYGAFNNSKDMALNLDFVSVFIDGVQFHFASWALLDDPTLMAAELFDTTSIAYVLIPTGNSAVMENGVTSSKPYINLRYRTSGTVNRKRQMKAFGVLGTPVTRDASHVQLLSELTVDMAGVNAFFVGRKTEFY